MTITLASSSIIRRELLLRAGVRVEWTSPQVDEDAAKHRYKHLRPQQMAVELATAKALSLCHDSSQDMIIGADQVLELDGHRLDKPASIPEARSQLNALRGKTHRLISGVACARRGTAVWTYVEYAELDVRPFSDEFLDNYLECIGNEATQSVGAYKLESLGAQLFEAVRGDYFTVLGLPLLPLLRFLRESGELAS